MCGCRNVEAIKKVTTQSCSEAAQISYQNTLFSFVHSVSRSLMSKVRAQGGGRSLASAHVECSRGGRRDAQDDFKTVGCLVALLRPYTNLGDAAA